MSQATDTVMQQYEAVRRSGKTNMFDVDTVQVIAYECDFHELVVFIEDKDPKEVIEMGERAAELGYQQMDNLPVEKVPDKITREVTL
jgi:hypothetical protein